MPLRPLHLGARGCRGLLGAPADEGGSGDDPQKAGMQWGCSGDDPDSGRRPPVSFRAASLYLLYLSLLSKKESGDSGVEMNISLYGASFSF